MAFWAGLAIWAAVGVLAASRRGFRARDGLLAGLMLGPLAFLLFAEMGHGKVKCLKCGRVWEANARFCKGPGCGATLPDPNG